MERTPHTKPLKTWKKWKIVILIDLIILGIIICFFGFIRPFSHPSIKINGVYIENPRDLPDIYLIDQHGNALTKKRLEGHWTLIFFGFTHCPMICPTTLDALNKMYAILNKRISPALLPQVVFISVDPEHDTIERLKQFINKYNSQFIAARTDNDKIKNIEKQLSVPVKNINGSIAHDTDILLVNPKGKVQAYFLYPHYPESMADDYQKIVAIKK